MLKVTLSEADVSNIRFVRDERVDIQDGQYGTWDMHKSQAIFVPIGSAVYVSCIHNEVTTGCKTLELYFFDSAGRRVTVMFPRRDLTETGILSLVTYGVQVTKQTAKALINSIQNQEIDAKQLLYHKKLGFIDYNGKTVFLGANGIGVDSVYTGDLRIAEQGSYQDWFSMVEEEVLGNIPLEMMLAVGVSGVVADYIKEDVNIENIIVHCINESSTGKTTAALLAVSCGGSTSFRGDGLVYSFADTPNALMASLNSSYPALIDEGSLCRNNPTNFLYNLSMGKERRRMTKQLELTDSSFFKTAIIITSEKSLLSMCDENSGLLVRNMQFEGVQWTRDALSADRIKSTVQNNYGFLVPKIAQILLQMEEKGGKDSLLKAYWKWCEQMAEDSKKDNTYNPLTERASKQSAVIMLAAELLTDKLHIPLHMEGILQMLEEYSLVNDPDKVDIGNRAHEYILEYLNRYYTNFISEEIVPSRECEGRIQACRPRILNDGREATRVLLISDMNFEKILKDGGFMDKKIVLKRLKALELLDSEKDRYISDIVIQDGIKVKGYKIVIPNGQQTRQHTGFESLLGGKRHSKEDRKAKSVIDEAETDEPEFAPDILQFDEED